MTTTTPVPAILVSSRSRTIETWSACIRGGSFELTSPSGQVGARITTADAGSRLKIPTFGGRIKHITIVANNGETILFKATRPMSRLARRFQLRAELVTGANSPTRKVTTGIGLLAASGAAVMILVMAYPQVLQQGSNITPKGGRNIVLVAIGALIAAVAGIRSLLHAKQMSSILAEFGGPQQGAESQQGAQVQRGESSQRHAEEAAALRAMPSISDAINRERADPVSQRDAA